MMTWLTVLLASALGSLHCVGMCGPLVSLYAAPGAAARQGQSVAHAAYHLTRLVAYAALGALAGGFGSALDALGARAGIGQLGVLLAALTIALWCLPQLLRRHTRGDARLRRGPGGRPRRWERVEAAFGQLLYRLRQRPPVWRASALGLSSALLPCGWLYGFVVVAAGTGSPLRGAALMASFWAGSVPALLGLAVGLERLGEPLRARLPRLTAALVLVISAFTIVQRWPVEAPLGASPSAPSCHGTDSAH